MKIDNSIMTLFICKFLVAFSNFVVTYLTFYLVNYKAISTNIAGMIVTIVSLSYVPATLVGGKIRLQKNKIKLVLCFFSSGILYVLVPFINILIAQLVMIVLGKFFLTITEPMIMSIINSQTKEIKEKKNMFSTMYLITNIGFAIGPMIAGIIYSKNIYLIFWIDGLLKILIAVILLFFYVENHSFTKKEYEHNYYTVVKKKGVIIFTFLIMTINWIYFQIDFSFPILFNDFFAIEGVKVYSMIMTTNAIVIIVGTKLINRVTIGFKSYFLVIVSGLFFSTALIGYTFSKQSIICIILMIFWSIGEILFYTNYTICINEIVGEESFSEAFALINSVSRVISILNPLVIGLILEWISIQNLLIYIAVLLIIVSVLYIPLRKVIYEKQN